MARAVAGGRQVGIEASLCSRFRTPKSDCDACAALCPESVIELSEKGPEIIGGCTDCGVCFSVCPNGAFRLEKRDDAAILGEIRGSIKEKGGEFRISCQWGDAESDLVTPCLSRLTETLLVGPALAGAARVELLIPPCGECPSHRAAPHFEKVARNARHLFRTLWPEDRLFTRKIPIKGFVSEPEEPVSRRAFLGALRKKAADAVASSLPEMPAEKSGGNDKPFHTILLERPPNVKRSTLLNALNGCPSVEQIEVPLEESLLAEIEVGPECTGCDTCVTLCPTGAISRPDGKNYQLIFRAHLCVNCRVCEKSCMPGALQTKESALLNHLLKRTEEVVFEAVKSTCAMCRQEFLSSDSEICPLCAGSHDKNMALVRSLLA